MTFMTRWFWYQNPVLRYLTLVTALLIFGQLIILIIGIEPQEDPIFLHYTTSFGVDFIGAWYLVYLIPFASMMILGVNGLLARALTRRDPYLGYLMLSGALAATFLLLIQAILLLYVNS